MGDKRTCERCKWCGAVQTGDHSHLYQCGSWTSASTSVVQSATCQSKCLKLRLQHEETIDLLHTRLADALTALTAIERHEAGSDLGFGIVTKHGDWVLFQDLQSVVDILTGNSPKKMEGST